MGFPKQTPQNKKEDQITKGFVELCWMSWKVLSQFFKDKTEVASRRLADNFRIHQIANANKESCQGNHNTDTVQYIEQRFVEDVFTVKIERRNDSHSCSMTCQACKSCKLKLGIKPNGQEDFFQMLFVIRPIVEKNMPQTRTQYGSQYSVNE